MQTEPKTLFHVLIVEDNPGDARLLQEYIAEARNAPFTVTKCLDRLSVCLDVLNTSDVDLILLDLTLPDSFGLETFLKARDLVPQIPIIILSGLDDEELALKTVNQGAQDYLVKGQFDGPLLIRAMRYAVERDRVEKQLASERNLLRNLLDHLPDYIYAKDAEGRYFIDNIAHMRLLKLQSADEIVGKTVFDFFPQELAQKYHADDQAIILSGQPLINREEPTLNADGARWLATTKVPLKGEQGEPVGLVCIGRDITEQKEAQDQLKQANLELSKNREELLGALDRLKTAHGDLRAVQLQLIEAEKMKSIGRLAAGVAHEVKNPLAIITMGIDYLGQLKLPDDGENRTILTEMADAVKRADDVIKGLLDFSAPKQLEVRVESLNAVIEQALLLVRGEISAKKPQILRDLEEDLPPIELDRAKINQVFVNLFTNALHAMEQGGTLSVRTYAKQLTGVGHSIGDNRAGTFRVGGTVVVAEIEDNGHGIPEDQLQKVFDPFFTTKPTGMGTGLGLTVTKTIIDLHGGTIDIRNRPTGGTKITIMFKA